MDRLPLVGVQCGVLIENGIGDTQLTDIMQQRCTANQLRTLRRQMQAPGNPKRRVRNSHGMTKSKVRLRIDDIRKGLTDMVDPSCFQMMLSACVKIKNSSSRVILTVCNSAVRPQSTATMK